MRRPNTERLHILNEASRTTATGCLLLALPMMCMGLWTIRADTPARPDEANPTSDHYLPLPGDGRLFTLEGGPNERYIIHNKGAACSTKGGDKLISAGEHMTCRVGDKEWRFTLRSGAAHLRLELDGVTVATPHPDGDTVTIGMGRDADIIFPIGGIGTRQIQILPMGACAALGEDTSADITGSDALLCVRNGGIGDGLIIDRSQSSETETYLKDNPDKAPQLRRALAHGEHGVVHKGNLLWVGQVPLKVDGTKPAVTLSLSEDWQTIAGDRVWMGITLPQWPLSRFDVSEDEQRTYEDRTFTFWTREQLFKSRFNPIFWNTHLRDFRYAHENEQILQSFIDHELLCYDPDRNSFTWRFHSGGGAVGQRVGCDGETPIPPPPGTVLRQAEEWAYLPGITDNLQRTQEMFADIEQAPPNPSEMLFVFDWGYQVPEQIPSRRQAYIDADGDEQSREITVRRESADRREMLLRPRRLLGVRAYSTRVSPARETERVSTEDACKLARKEITSPPFDVQAGSTSDRLEVIRDGALPAGTQLLLVGETASLCSGSNGRVGESLSRPRNAWTPATIPLGHLSLGSSGPLWQASALTERPQSCALIKVSGDGWQITDNNDTHTLHHGERLSLSGLDLMVKLLAPENPDRAVDHILIDREPQRIYPFGAAMAPLLGVERLYGGLQTTIDRRAREKAVECDDERQEPQGVKLTIQGDLQRIVYKGLMDVYRLKNLSQESVSGQAVLLDSKTGSILAAANAPSFDPADPEIAEFIQSNLRLYGDHWTPDKRLLNLAFKRAGHVGSTYKLATSYAMANAGVLDDSSYAPLTCERMAFYQLGEDNTLSPAYSPTDKRADALNCKKSMLAGGRTGDSFNTAFKKSYNAYFALAPLALLSTSGVSYGRQPMGIGSTFSVSNASATQPGLWGFGQSFGITLAPNFEPDKHIADIPNNPFLQVMLGVGHRFHYRFAGGGGLNTQRVDEIQEYRFPTVDNRWMLGVSLNGFSYPSMWGPESFTVRKGLWGSRSATLRWRQGQDDPREKTTKLATQRIREYAKSAYGFGGIQASALSLATLATPVARPSDCASIAPDILDRPQRSEGPRVVQDKLIRDCHRSVDSKPDSSARHSARKRIEDAMRSVLGPGGTANSYYRNMLCKGRSTCGAFQSLVPRIGGKTGTFETGGGARKITDTAEAYARSALMLHGCGVADIAPSNAQWELIRQHLSGARQEWVRGVLHQVVQDGQSGTLPAGFAASARECEEFTPNRAGAGQMFTVGGERYDGGIWLDTVEQIWPVRSEKVEMAVGGAFVGVAFDGLTDGSTQAESTGLILAVIFDGSEKAAKEASALIFDLLRRHYAIRDANAPVPAP